MAQSSGTTGANIVSLDGRRAAPPQQAAKRRTRRQFGFVRRLPSKMYQASYLGPDGLRHNAPTTFQTKGHAEAWLSLEQSKIIRNRWRPAPPPASVRTLAAYGENWLASRKLRPRTRAEYRRILDAKIIPALGSVTLAGLTPARVRDWYADLDPEHKTARAHAYAMLRTVLASAVHDELIPANPCRISGAVSYTHLTLPTTPYV